ncbi:MAG: MotA/TolQ/ExbB proton channel family protein [Acidobacteriia bacterium]|nr:MotA/TolQ/ExbB proton channel family protein [Terriglobia bacterium]
MPLPHWNGILLQVNFWELVGASQAVPLAVMAILLGFSLLSFTIIFSKLGGFRRARRANQRFLKAFRKSSRLDAVAAAVEQFRAAPLVTVFDFGYSELSRQMASRSKLTNLVALERSLQMGISEEITRLERNMNWLATAAAVCPFIGLFGTVLGIIDAFTGLGLAGSTSMRAVAPGIASALVATALGLGAAIPAAIAYNYFNNAIKEIGQRLEDFSLEFLNVAERTLEG